MIQTDAQKPGLFRKVPTNPILRHQVWHHVTAWF